MVKKGIFFSIDALISIFLVIIILALVPLFYTSKTHISQAVHMSSDISNIISNIKVNEITDPIILDMIMYEDETNYNISVLEQIGRFYVAEKYELAENLSKTFLANYIPSYYGFGLWIDNKEIFSNNKSLDKQLVTAKQMVTGIQEGRAIEGYSSKVFLSGIDKKTTSSYIFFGGYVGDGNITQRILLPDTLDSVNNVYLELDISNDFDLYINNNLSGRYLKTAPYMSADKWNIGSGNFSFFIPGTNYVSIKFPNQTGYIAGGYLKAAYSTSDLDYSPIDYFGSTITQRYWFPEIKGIANLYDSFYIPGTLQSIESYLHYYNDYNAFLTIGNETVYNNENSTGENLVNLFDTNFSSLDYNELSKKTVPIRFGSKEILGTLPADIVLATDVSGSMDDFAGECSYEPNCRYDCRDKFWFWCYDSFRECPYTGDCSGTVCGTCGCNSYSNYQVYDKLISCNKTKLDLAKDADNEFVDIVLGISNKRVGLVSYESNIDNYTGLLNDSEELHNTINNYTAGGYTCICCGIVKATEILNTGSGLKHMVVMSDGDANRQTGCGCSGLTNSECAIQKGQEACAAGIDVYTVAFGEDLSQSGINTLKGIACDESNYYDSTNVSRLLDVYRDIVDAILIYISQQANVSYSTVSTILYGDSYIDLTYTPDSPQTQHGKIPITLESPRFGNTVTTGTFNIPYNVDIFDAKLTSYSSDKWTQFAAIKNLSTGNNITFYNLSYYSDDYQILGDPYIIYIPVGLVQNGDNEIMIATATNSYNLSGGSVDNKAIYTIGLTLKFNYSGIYPKSEGCSWSVEFEDGTTGVIKIPADYEGTENCIYNSTEQSYDEDDAINQAVYHLFKQLDIDDDGKLYVNFQTGDISTDIASIEGVPYMWGPSIMELRVWQ